MNNDIRKLVDDNWEDIKGLIAGCLKLGIQLKN